MINVGDAIEIIHMEGEPQYDGATGIVTSIGQDFDRETYYRGTWGGLSIYPSRDRIKKIC